MKYPANAIGGVGEQVNLAYTVQGPVNSVIGSSTYVYSTTYDALGRVEARKLGNDTLRQDYVYYPWTTANGQGRLHYLKTGTPTNNDSLQDLRYTYDAVGNVHSLQICRDGACETNQTFSYDALDRLTGASGPYAESYAYANNDGKIGNLTSKGGVGYAYSDNAAFAKDKHCFYNQGFALFCLPGGIRFWMAVPMMDVWRVRVMVTDRLMPVQM